MKIKYGKERGCNLRKYENDPSDQLLYVYPIFFFDVKIEIKGRCLDFKPCNSVNNNNSFALQFTFF